jgi:putative sterol carrier protein
MTVAETLEQLQSLFNPEAAAGVNKTIQLEISGAEAGTWAVKIANKTCQLIPGNSEKPDLTLFIKDKDWLALVQRKLDPMSAFMTGKLKTKGDMGLAMQIPRLFRLQ